MKNRVNNIEYIAQGEKEYYLLGQLTDGKKYFALENKNDGSVEYSLILDLNNKKDAVMYRFAEKFMGHIVGWEKANRLLSDEFIDFKNS